MTFLLTLVLIALLVNVFSRSGSAPRISEEQRRREAEQSQGWIDFIAGYEKVVTKSDQKALLERMLGDIKKQGIGEPSPGVTPNQPLGAAEVMYASEQPENMIEEAPRKPAIELDNTSLLLYFGAFLFVAATGLFIAFGGMSGVARTFAVLLVMAVMYASGVWLFRHRPRLEQAGLAFAGIGLIIAPLVGLAAYAYIFNKSHGYEAWFLTSVLCLGLYAHALSALKKTFISYLFIFTFLSLFESSIGITQVPVYYFGWGLALVGIILLLVNQWKGYWPELRESSRQSARVFLPLSLVVSVALLPQHGATQLGVSLVLAAAFYALQAASTKDSERSWNAVVSQATITAAVPAIAYGVSHDWAIALFGLFVMNMLQLIVFLWGKHTEVFWQHYASVLLVSGLVAIFLSVGKYQDTLSMLLGLVFIGAIIWWRQHRVEAYTLAGLALVVAPVIYGQFVAVPHLQAAKQTVAGLVALFVLLVAHLSQSRSKYVATDWHNAARFVFLIGSGSVAVASVFASPLVCLLACVAIAAEQVVLAEYEVTPRWAEVAGLFLLVPLWRSWNDAGLFLASTLTALVILMVLSLRYRRETLRWASTAVWLLLPLALGRYDFIGHWTAAAYAWSYLLAMVGLILSRSIARGVIFMSSTSPLASFARNASLSYVFGYWLAAALAISISLTSHNSQLHTSLLLACITLITIVLCVKVEKRDDLYALLPALMQALLLSGVRPVNNAASMQLFLAGSTALALVSYAAAASVYRRRPTRTDLTYPLQTALFACFVAPLAVVFAGQSTWLMAIGLLIAGTLSTYHVRMHKQSDREWAGAIIALAIMWLLYIGGIRELQAYVHVVIFLLGFYAYWRATRGEASTSDDYLKATLATATVPLALQALSGHNSTLYGWWLLLEQIAIMLVGMGLRKRFVTFWGLYVAFAAVLYQLRSLGYAALGALALFLIGLAIYQLQRQNK